MPTLSKSIDPAVARRLAALGVRPEEVTERFVRGGGPGGQKINKASTLVQLRHQPTGVEVRCQSERSQAMNRAAAWEALCEKLEEGVKRRRAAQVAEIEKHKRSTRGRSRRQKQKSVEQKRRQSEKKSLRRAVDS